MCGVRSREPFSTKQLGATGTNASLEKNVFNDVPIAIGNSFQCDAPMCAIVSFPRKKQFSRKISLFALCTKLPQEERRMKKEGRGKKG